MKIKEIDIFKYKDYRKLLNDVFEHQKATKRNYTYGKWAEQIGLSSISGLTMILKGQRHAGKSILDKLVVNLELDKKEEDYLRKLVKIQKQAKDDQELVVFLMDNGNVNQDNDLEDKNRPIEFRWEMGLLREATKWNDLKEDNLWLNNKARFPSSYKNYGEVLEDMKDKKLITYSDGALKINNDYIPSKVDSRYFKHLHNDFMAFAKDSYQIDFNLRSLEYRMIVVKKEDVTKAKQRLIELLDIFVSEFDTNSSSSEESDVYLTALQFFPMTK